jgi:predicted 3-demethylubiquinone-9 3-methyltransferase (glyoxalase superfamily)
MNSNHDEENPMEKIYPMLWFDGQAEEAAKHYVSIFPNSKLGRVSRYTAAGPLPEGTVMTVDFELDGQRFVALNGGPEFTFNESISFVVPCESQVEVDEYWDKLIDGGEPSACGWLKDRYGLSWQVVPIELDQMMLDPDPVKAQRVTEAMLKVWGKFDIAELRAAYEGEPVGSASR